MADDPFAGRPPTSHERLTGRPWDASYLDGPAPWDAGRPQPALVQATDDGAITGSVLDVGCGTGENALHLASLGCQVLGVDVARTALGVARAKAAERGIDASFAVADALDLRALQRTFGTVVDCGLFHTFDADERLDYVAGLTEVLAESGVMYLLCFSDATPDTGGGPHHISKAMLASAFAHGWELLSVDPALYETRFGTAPAWWASIRRSATAA